MEKMLGRLEHVIEDLKVSIANLEESYKKAPYGTHAFDIALKIENNKGQLRAYEEMQLYAKYDCK